MLNPHDIPPYISRAFYVLLERAVMSSRDTSVRWLASSPFSNAHLSPSRAFLQTYVNPPCTSLLHSRDLVQIGVHPSVGVRKSSIVSTGHSYSFSLLVFRYDHIPHPNFQFDMHLDYAKGGLVLTTSRGPSPSVRTSHQLPYIEMQSLPMSVPTSYRGHPLWLASTSLCDASRPCSRRHVYKSKVAVEGGLFDSKVVCDLRG